MARVFRTLDGGCLAAPLAAVLAGCASGTDSRTPATHPAVGAPASSTAPITGSTGAAGTRPVAGAAERPSANDCLDCHGPFNKLIEATANFQASSGEKTSPHRYVPHDSKQAVDIPECTNCHKPHSLASLPSKGDIELSAVSVEWCYSCHHEKNFKSCKECHP